MIDLALCMDLLPPALKAGWAVIDPQIPALWRIAEQVVVPWPAWQGGWVNQGCFLSRTEYEGASFWMLSSALN